MFTLQALFTSSYFMKLYGKRHTEMRIYQKCIVTFAAAIILAVFCQASITLKELPVEIAYQMETLMLNQTMARTEHCPKLKNYDINLLLYTRKDSRSAVVLNVNSPTDIDYSKQIVLIIHGWIAGSTSYGFQELKDAYLERCDCNVIMVDWSKLSWQLYPYSVCELPKIANILADFLCLIGKEKSLETVHLVGHSLGGQMSGLIGQNVMVKCSQKIGRITAMDPAGPLFQGLPKSLRLDKSDASFVQVIHTNQGVLGYFGNCGDVDFYVNCGKIQAGCPETYFDAEAIMDHTIETVSCDHFRSVNYTIESINSPNFKANSCKTCWGDCRADSSKLDEVVMGEDCPKHAKGNYVLYTNPESPFAIG